MVQFCVFDWLQASLLMRALDLSSYPSNPSQSELRPPFDDPDIFSSLLPYAIVSAPLPMLSFLLHPAHSATAASLVDASFFLFCSYVKPFKATLHLLLLLHTPPNRFSRCPLSALLSYLQSSVAICSTASPTPFRCVLFPTCSS
eukprot:6209734-Pleurochrysis_carterae.AAC.1